MNTIIKKKLFLPSYFRNFNCALRKHKIIYFARAFSAFKRPRTKKKKKTKENAFSIEYLSYVSAAIQPLRCWCLTANTRASLLLLFVHVFREQALECALSLRRTKNFNRTTVSYGKHCRRGPIRMNRCS